MAGKTPTEPTVDQQRQFLNALMQKYTSGELTAEQQQQFWSGLGSAHEQGITGGNTQEGKDLYQFTKSSMYDTALPEELRQQIAESYYLRQGTPYIDPTKPYTVPDYNGMGNDGGQRTPTTVTDWGGSPSHGQDGSIIPGGSADPDRYAYRPAQGINFGGGTTPPGAGGNAGSGGAGGTGGGLYGPPMPFGGYQGPNEALYAEQFGNLKAGGDAYQEQALAAAIRKQQQDAQPQQPFDFDSVWSNLPEVRVNQAAPGSGEAYSWKLNPAYDFTPGETSNADLLRGVMGNSAFTDSDRNWFNRAMEDGNMDNDYFWAQQSNPQDIVSKFDYAGDNRARMERAINLAFAREDLSTPEGGGPAAPPPGYAAPR